jgi:hypothetical protein
MEKAVTEKEINLAAEVLKRLVVQGKYSHMKAQVQTVIGGLLLPYMASLGPVKNPEIKKIVKQYSKKSMEEEMVEMDSTIAALIQDAAERPVFRRIKEHINKESRKQIGLDTDDRDLLIRWWNVNQRLIDKDDPVCTVLADQTNANHMDREPISAMQVAGYFSHLCRMGLKIEEERKEIFQRSISRGVHTIMPTYSEDLLQQILENWEAERANEKARKEDHNKLIALRMQGIHKPVTASL